ncbi:unnamed protein product [Anisakis simplex]|uniref:IBB domain-containing protein n=1 Tax=Anisakis simplex TaxID=6269 RepID=A0A0M3J6Z5_ANISI|nr:unnamed protein product [Anisakis simplex]
MFASPVDALSPGGSREAMYKNKGMTSVEMRKRRETNTAQLRKQKRDNEISKRRNIDENADSSACEEDESMVKNSSIKILFLLLSFESIKFVIVSFESIKSIKLLHCESHLNPLEVRTILEASSK